jgi:acyl dehydratase
MRYFEDIEPGQKERFGSYHVTKEEIVAFAGRYDPQPFHLDEEAAKRSLFGGICASGWHTAAMTMRLVVDDFTSKGVASLGSPGGDHLRWRRPSTRAIRSRSRLRS